MWRELLEQYREAKTTVRVYFDCGNRSEAFGRILAVDHSETVTILLEDDDGIATIDQDAIRAIVLRADDKSSA